MKILIVEDDLINQRILQEHLHDAGYQTITAENGKIGLEKLEQESNIDLILLDRMMPEMDGMEFMEIIRQDERFRDIPVVMETAATQPPEVIEGASTGVYYYLSKPFSAELLLSVVRAAMANEPTSAADAS